MIPVMMIGKSTVGFFVTVEGDYYLTPFFISWGGEADEILGLVVLRGVKFFYFAVRLYLWPLKISIAMPRI